VRLVVQVLAALAVVGGLAGLEMAELGLAVEAILAVLVVVGGWVQVASVVAIQDTAAEEAGDTVPILGT